MAECCAVVSSVVPVQGQASFIAPVSSVFGRVGAIAALANDYAASLIANDSGVPGLFVDDALDALGAVLAGLSSDDVANASVIAGATVTDALDALNPLLTRRQFYMAETNGGNAGHRVRNVGAAGNFDFNFVVPADFTTLVSLRMWGASRGATNPAAPITITSSFGVPPAGPQAITVAAGITPALVTGQLFTYSIASVFGALAANAQCAVNINHGGIGGSVDYYGIMLEYT